MPGRTSISTVKAQSARVIGLDQRIVRSPSEIDSARRRLLSIISPRTKPRISEDSGKSILRS
ncbi:hypothetical protein D3C78_1984220 [compost metagenome]